MSDLNKRQSDDTLDALIRGALREQSAEPEPLQTERMARYWQSLGESEVTSSSRRLAPWVAAAALLIAAGGLVTYSMLSPGESSQPAEIAEDKPLLKDDRIADTQHQDQETRAQETREVPEFPEPAPKPPMQPETGIAANNSALPDSPSSIGREPTNLERMAFIARTRTRIPKAKKTLPEATGDLLERLVKSPTLDLHPSQALAEFASTDIEQELLKRLPLGTPEEQQAMLRLLAVYGSESSLESLIPLTEIETIRDETLLALEAIAGIESWPQLTQRITNAEARQAISERLIAALDDSDTQVRLAATEAIGRSFDCGVTEDLIERVVRQPSQNEETWFALFACRCPQANAFLLDASQNPKLLGQFNHARLQWALKGIGDRG